jgi:hypothetical protein
MESNLNNPVEFNYKLFCYIQRLEVFKLITSAVFGSNCIRLLDNVVTCNFCTVLFERSFFGMNGNIRHWTWKEAVIFEISYQCIHGQIKHFLWLYNGHISLQLCELWNSEHLSLFPLSALVSEKYICHLLWTP